MFIHQPATIALLVCLCGLTLSGARRAKSADQVGESELLRKAENEKRQGKLEDAVKTYDQLRRAAAERGQSELEAKANLDQGRARHALARQGKDVDQQTQLAIDNYQAAIRLGDPSLQALARNDLAALYIRAGDGPKALEYLSECDPDQIKPEHRYVYHYNFGRALQLDRQNERALDCYWKTLQSNPRFEPALERTFEVLDSSPDSDAYRDGEKYLRLLLSQGQVELARRWAIQLLARHTLSQHAPKMLTILVQSYAQSYIPPTVFRNKLWLELAELTDSDQWKEPVEEIRKAYLDDFKQDIQPSDERPLTSFPYWSARERAVEQRSAFSALLKRIGDYYAQYRRDEDNPERRKALGPDLAFTRYTTAWMIDQENAECAILAAALLRDYRKTIDPGGTRYKALMDEYFLLKGVEYRRPVKSVDAWKKIRAMHFILGSIFEGESRWGSKSDVRSAVFQWSLAQRAEKELERAMNHQGLEFRPNPAIHKRLADALRRSEAPHERTEAFRNYMGAARGFIEAGRHEEARQAVASARSLDLSSEQERELAAIEADIGDGP
jgi:tetratricopeptide (TPR) repeat protein